MTFDLISLAMVLLAFVGGFQKGVVKIFSFLVAAIFAFAIVIWSAPYIFDFIQASLSNIPTWLPSLIFVVEFCLACMLFVYIFYQGWRHRERKKESLLQNTLGGIFLSSFMLLSIAVLSGFAEQTNILREPTKQESIVYKVLMPVHEKGRHLWRSLTSHMTIARNTTDAEAKILNGG